MHTVDRIRIEGFRGHAEPLVLKFDERVNFIIGRNGTGKTSLINTINAALSGDIRYLKAAAFQTIAIRLKVHGSNRRPTITFTKKVDGDKDECLYYSIQNKASENAELEVAEHHEDSWNPAYRLSLLGKSPWTRRTPQMSSNLRNQISKLVKTTWLSIHRSSEPIDIDPDREFESPIDQRLHHVFRKFGTFFSTLDKESAAKTDLFQTAYFLSLISPPKVDALSGEAKEISADAERQALNEMFSEFGLPKATYLSKLESFTKQVERAVEWQKGGRDNKGVPANIFLTLTDALRIEGLVKEWSALLDDRAKIYSPKTDFIEILNSLLYKKVIIVNKGNQPLFKNVQGVEISPDDLSSGEKQLIIILGEALVQRGESYIFMADEPELSLHIDWQERLVPSLRLINPSSQIIFATHSPDIVGAYGANTIDLEKVLG